VTEKGAESDQILPAEVAETRYAPGSMLRIGIGTSGSRGFVVVAAANSMQMNSCVCHGLAGRVGEMPNREFAAREMRSTQDIRNRKCRSGPRDRETMNFRDSYS